MISAGSLFNIFEHPWTLLLAAVVTALCIKVFNIFAKKERRWLYFLPFIIAAAAFGLDLLIQTDFEKITSLIKTGIKSAENENTNAIASLIAEDYTDPVHDSKRQLLDYCRHLFESSAINKISLLNSKIEVENKTASAEIKTLITFEQNSDFAEYGFNNLLIKLRLDLIRNGKKQWLVRRTELLELNNQTVNWKHIR